MASYDGVSAPTIAIQFLKSGTWTTVTAADVLTTTIRRGRSRQDQRDASGTGPPAGHATAGILLGAQKGQQGIPDAIGLGLEARVEGRRSDAGQRLALAHAVERSLRRAPG